MAEQVSQKHATISDKFKWAVQKEYFLIKCFKILTACPISITRDSHGIKSKFEKSIRFWSFFAIILTILYFIGIIILRFFFIHSSEHDFGLLSEAINICGFMLTCLTIIIETQFTYRELNEFILLKEKLEQELQTLCRRELFENQKYLLIGNYWRSLIVFQIIAWLAEILNIFSLQKNQMWRFYCCCLVIPIMITRFRYFQHRLYTGTLHSYIKMIRIKFDRCNKEIDPNGFSARHRNQKCFTLNTKKIFTDFNLSMSVFSSISQMASLVNRMFGVSLLMSLLGNFVQLLSNLFWIYMKLHREDLAGLTGLKDHCTHLYLNYF